MGKLILVTGGARSGKSCFAEKYARSFGHRVAYIATAEVYDEEMAFRVKLHKERRPADWLTFDAPHDAENAVAKAARASCDFILFDCLTLYVSNIFGALTDIEDSAKNYAEVQAAVDKLIAAAKEFDGAMLIVTNEVGGGIVPMNRLAREYRDLAGIANQTIAAAADEVYLVVCGLATELKNKAITL